ncbi:ATP-binding cassette, sub-B (MDR TAP), member 8, partial [Dinochytrium kinnereticum]
LLTFIDITLVTRLGESLSLRLRHTLHTTLLHNPLSFHDAHQQGELLNRLTQDVQEFKHAFKLVITQGLRCVAQIAGTVWTLVRISGRLTGVLAGVLPVVYLGMNVYGAFLRRLSEGVRRGEAGAAGVAGESISNIRTVRAFAAEDREVENYMTAATQSSGLSQRLGFHIGLFQAQVGVLFGQVIKALGSASRVFEYIDMPVAGIPIRQGICPHGMG